MIGAPCHRRLGPLLAAAALLVAAGCSAAAPATPSSVSPSAAGASKPAGSAGAQQASPSAAGPTTATSRPPAGTKPSSTPAATGPIPAVSGIPTAGVTSEGALVSVHQVQADGMSRTWVEYAPPGGTAGKPLVVFLHGTDSTVKFEATRDHLIPLVAAGDFTLIYPAGYHQTWNAGANCCGDAATVGVDDIAFVRLVTAQAMAQTKADPARIYLTGYSGGAKVGWELVCDSPAPFAALSSYGANPTTDCSTSGPSLPVLIGFGAKDLAEPIKGQATDKRGPHPPAAVNVRVWRTRDHCPDTSHITRLTDVNLQKWSCPGADDVVYAVWPRAKHVWPQPPLTTLAGSPARVMWTFMSGYRAATATPSASASAPAG